MIKRKGKNVSGDAFDFPVLSRLFLFVKPYRFTFYISVWLTLVIAIVAPLRPWLIQYTFDHHIISGDFAGLTKYTIILVALLLLQTTLQYYHTFYTNFIGQMVVRDMRVKLFRHLLRFRLRFFDRTPVGTPVTRTVSDMETVSDIFSEGIIVIIGDILQLVIIIAFMFYANVELALVSLSVLPLLIIATNIFKNKIKEAFRDVRTQVARLNVFVQEHLTGMYIVQMFNREKEEMEKFREINEEHKQANIRSIYYYSIFFPVVEILSASAIGLLVWWGTKGVIANEISLGTVIAFILYINMLFRPIRELADKFNTLQMGMVSSERVFKVLDTNEEEDYDSDVTSHNIKGEINFRNVWFAYEDENWVLKNFNLHVNPNETIALVGATGAGKSSVISLLTRLYNINKGEITIDDINLYSFNLSTLRRQVALVLQDVFLFSDTIHNNITLKDQAITIQQVEEAAIAVGANKFIEKLPGAYNFNVMERGGMLSVGQRQLLAFIRAYIVNPSILILDEATSSLDTESEELIQEATKKLTTNRTSIIIAHRLATIQNADKIIVMDQGQVKEAGSHTQLLRHNGFYKNLYDVQFSRLKV